MSIVVELENPLRGAPMLRLVEPGESRGAASQLKAISKALIATLEARLDSLPTAADKDGLVKDIGSDLLAVLNCHPAIAAAMKHKLDAARTQEEPIYLYFRHRIQKLESWPWEMLYAPNVGFVAQDRKFAIARSQGSPHGRTEWSFRPPLKILAVLGASGPRDNYTQEEGNVPGNEQWEGLRAAIAASGMPVELRVLTCQRSLVDAINRKRLPWAGADLLPPRKGACPGHVPPSAEAGLAPRDLLFDYISAYKPHILHLFCHATSDPLPQLQVATYSDWEEGRPGSILVEGRQLKQRADAGDDIWMVTLNCCESAQYGPGTGSLSMPVAAALAGEGVPAVIGMRERIPSDFANAFSRLFYGTLLDDLHRRLARVRDGDGLVDIHWACGLFAIRQIAADGVGAPFGWTLPIMHTAYDFKLRVNARPRPRPATVAPARPPAGARPEARRQAPRPQPARAKQRLSARDIAELEDELMQLYEDLKLVNNPQVAKLIHKRVAVLNRRLSKV